MFDTFDDEAGRDAHRLIATSVICSLSDQPANPKGAPPLRLSYTRIALTKRLRRTIDEGVGYGLTLEGISAADIARSTAANN
jgi:hypothetical protein